MESVELVDHDVTNTEAITITQQTDATNEFSECNGIVSTGVDEGGQQIIIVATNSTDSQELETLQTSSDGLEPATKKIRIQHENGQTYVLAVSDSVLAEHLQSPSTGNHGNNSNNYDRDLVEAAEEADTDISQAWFTTKDDKSALQNKGHSWKQGQWAREEVEILSKNIAQYCQDHGIADPTEIIFEMSKDERKDFYRCIARGLDRPLFSVYRRVIRMYDQRNHIGKYSPEEIQKLKELRAKHGSDWATIGAALGRSASSVKDRCRLMKDTCNTGKWLPDEEQRLAQAVYEQTGCKPGESITSGLSWASVAEKVITRSEKQCRTKWLNYLNWKQKGGSEWTREDDIALVLKISESGATEESRVDWAQLARGWPSVRSPQWLRGKWWSMKRHIPDYQLLPFIEIVECLKNVHSLNLKLKAPSSSARNRVNITTVVPETQTLQIPVVVSGADGLGNVLATAGGEQQVQALEILPGFSGSSGLGQGAFLITQPHLNPAISLATGGHIPSDHIIVHTLPVVQEGSEAVALNHQVIIGVPSHEGMNVPVQEAISMQLQEAQSKQHADDELQVLAHAVEMTDASRSLVTDGQNVTLADGQSVTLADGQNVTLTDGQNITLADGQNVTLSDGQSVTLTDGQSVTLADGRSVTLTDGQTEVLANTTNLDAQESNTINTTEPFDTQVLSTGVVHTDLEGVVATTDLVLTASASPQFAQAPATLIHMSSLSDPMLTSSDADLMGSCSDVEAEKVPLVVEDPDVEREVDSPAT